ncbi:V(D)J recombination-activating protein 1-like [Saccoglossus kowalevskii]
MDLHREKLRNYCRLCGEARAIPYEKYRNPTAKQSFSTSISKYFSVDVESEDCHIFPPFICQICHKKMHRWKKRFAKKLKCSLNINVASFHPHDSGCRICFSNTSPDDVTSERRNTLLETVTKIAKNGGFVVEKGEKSIRCIKLVNQSQAIGIWLEVEANGCWSCKVYSSMDK